MKNLKTYFQRMFDITPTYISSPSMVYPDFTSGERVREKIGLPPCFVFAKKTRGARWEVVSL